MLEVNTWYDWHIVPTKRPVFNPPPVKEHIIDIPGKDGVLDFTESLTGYPMFSCREGSFEFVVMNGYQEWYELYAKIGEFLHGNKLKAILEDEPDKFYEGRFQIGEWRSEKDYARITIKYKVDPLKWTMLTSSQSNPQMFIAELSESNPGKLMPLVLTRSWIAVTSPFITVTNGAVTVDYIQQHDGTTETIYSEYWENDSGQLIGGDIRRPTMDEVTTAFYMHWESGTPTVKVDFRRGYI